MPVQLPESLRRVLGEEAAPYFVSTVQEIVAEMAVPRDEYRQVLSRLDILEHDVADIKVEVRDLRREMNERFDRMNEQMNERFDRMSERFDQMYQHFETLFDRQNRHAETRFDQMYDRMLGQTRWMIATIAAFGTLITILLAISQFTP